MQEISEKIKKLNDKKTKYQKEIKDIERLFSIVGIKEIIGRYGDLNRFIDLVIKPNYSLSQVYYIKNKMLITNETWNK